MHEMSEMPKIRSRSTNKAKWSSETLSKAEVLISQGHSMRNAIKAMNIPFCSFQKRLKKIDSSESRLGRLPVFTADVEKVLSDRIKYLSSMFYGVTAIQIRKTAYQYAEELNISHNFDKNFDFLKRNGISVRKPEAISINRITAFNKEEVQLFYRLLGDLMDKYKFTSNNIYNRDETGISTVQDPGKILALKGTKRVGSITSWERSKNITLLCAMSAASSFVPPMLSMFKITPYDVAAILNKAYSTVASINKGQSGFRASGIVPYNPKVFTEEDFTAAEVLTESDVIIQDTSIIIPSTSSPTDTIPSTSSAAIHHMPSTSSIAVESIPSTSPATGKPGILNSNIECLLPLPVKMISKKLIRKGRARQHAKNMTSTPVKDSLIEKEKKKAAKATKGKNLVVKASKKQKHMKNVAHTVKRRVIQDLNTSSESEISLNKICDDDEDDDSNKCLVCDEFGRNNELWYRCTSCGFWVHANCTGWDSPQGYVCDNC